MQNSSELTPQSIEQQIMTKPLQKSIYNQLWCIRQALYIKLLCWLQNIKFIDEQLIICKQNWKIQQLVPYLDGLIDQKHPAVLLKGLQCVEKIIKLSNQYHFKNKFLRLINQGFQKFPLLTQQKKLILQKFVDILQLCQIQSSMLKNRLSLPQQKSVMFVLEVIAIFNIQTLIPTIIEISKKHPKKHVKQLAYQISQQLQGINIEQQQNKKKPLQKPNKKQKIQQINSSNNNSQINRIQLIQKLPQYQTLDNKQKQIFSTIILQNIQSISKISLNQCNNISYYIRLMIQDNNYITSTNGIKILNILIQKQSLLIPSSYPLLFIFEKFKSHATHPINALMFTIIDNVMFSNRFVDLLNAIAQGLNCKGSKANVKYGCSLSYIRVIALAYKNQQLYEYYFGQIEPLQYEIKMDRNCDKYIRKIYELLIKDKKYWQGTKMISKIIGWGQPKHNNNQKLNNTKRISNVTPKKSISNLYKNNNNYISNGQNNNLQQYFKKLQKSLQAKTQTSLITQIEAIIQNLSYCIKYQKYKLFYYCQLIQTFLINYIPNENNMIIISDCMIKSLKMISKIKIRQNQKYNGIQQLLRITLCSLIMQEQLNEILDNIVQNYPFQKILEILMRINKPIRRKNRIYLINWLEQNTPISCLNSNYYNLLEQIQNGKNIGGNSSKNNKKKKQNLSKENSQKKNYNQSIKSPRANQSRNKSNVSIKSPFQKDKSSVKAKISPMHTNVLSLYDKVSPNKSKVTHINTPKSSRSSISAAKSPINSQKSSSSVYNNISTHHHSTKQLLTQNKIYDSQNQQYLPVKSNIYGTENNQKIEYDQLFKIPVYKRMQRTPPRQERPININKQRISINQQKRDQNVAEVKKDVQQMNKNVYQMNKNIQQMNRNIGMNKNGIYMDKYGNQKIKQDYCMNQDDDYNLSPSVSHEHQSQLQKAELSQIAKDHNESPQKVDQKWQYFLHKHADINTDRNRDKDYINQEKKYKDISKLQSQQYQQTIKYKKEQEQQIYKPINDNSMEQGIQYQPYKQQQYQQLKYYNRAITKPNEYLHEQQQYKNKVNNQIAEQLKSPICIANKNKNTTSSNNCRSYSKDQSILTTVKTNKQSSNNYHHEAINSYQDGSEIQKQTQHHYQYINQEKLNFMLESTNNPYPHLRTMVIIPFKSNNKKLQFLNQLSFFIQNCTLQHPQPYNAILLMIILLFAEIQQDKSLIGPLQSLYEFMAKQVNTNYFLKIIITIIHNVIQQTIPTNRTFIITILTRSMLRMIPFIEDSLALLKDIQQFYQIGEMVYFEMFPEQYQQICQALQNQQLYDLVYKSVENDTYHVVLAVIDGWLSSNFKNKVKKLLEQITVE